MKKFWKNNQKIIKFVFFLFIVWQIFLFVLNFASPFINIPRREGYNYVELKPFSPKFLWNRANFDGIHYLDISIKGYGIYQQAFFPMYPNLIKLFNPFFLGRDLLSGIFISNISFLVLLFLFYKLVIVDYKESEAKKILIIFLIFPLSFFFGMVYTESLFLMLVLGSFYAARRNKWLWAGILGGLASYTRFVGIFLFPALLYEWYSYGVKDGKRDVGKLMSIFLVPLGLLNYIRFLWEKYGDPFMFMHVLPFYGSERSSGKIILLYQVFWRYLKMILTTKMDPLYIVVWLELFISVLFLALILLSFKKGIRTSYLIFSTFAYLSPTLSGTFSSLPRYVLILFPCFMYLGLIKNKLFKNFVYAIFGIGFIIFAIMFFQGYWVA